jgi:hypothetical protein
VTKFYVAHDCGQIVNPDGLRNQLDGNVIQTVSRTLMEELKYDRSAVTSLDWESYPILRFPQIPELVYDLIDRPNERPWGAGAPSMVNAIRAGILESRACGISILLVEQNLRLALSVGDVFFVLSRGTVVFRGTRAELQETSEIIGEHLGIGRAKRFSE